MPRLLAKVFTADSNYHNQSNLEKCQQEKLDADIPDLKLRNRDLRFATRPRNKPKKGKKFILQDFKYDEVKDCYICPNGKILKIVMRKHSRDRNIYRRYMANEQDCKQCSLKSRCFYRKNTKRRLLDVPIGAEKNNFSKAMQNKVDFSDSLPTYARKSALSEKL